MIRKLLLTLIVVLGALWIWRLKIKQEKSRSKNIPSKENSSSRWFNRAKPTSSDLPTAMVACESCGVYFAPPSPIKDGVTYRCSHCLNHH